MKNPQYVIQYAALFEIIFYFFKETSPWFKHKTMLYIYVIIYSLKGAMT